MVRGELPKAIADRRVFKAFVRFGQFTPEQARQAIGKGAKPRLAIADLDVGVYGNYPGSGDTIRLNRVIARQYEKLLTCGYQPYGKPADWDRLLRQGTKMVEAILLHEIVHWHDKQSDGLFSDRPNPDNHDWGQEFETAAYGKILSSHDIEGWMGWRYIQHRGRTHTIAFDDEPGYTQHAPFGRR